LAQGNLAQAGVDDVGWLKGGDIPTRMIEEDALWMLLSKEMRPMGRRSAAATWARRDAARRTPPAAGGSAHLLARFAYVEPAPNGDLMIADAVVLHNFVSSNAATAEIELNSVRGGEDGIAIALDAIPRRRP
jgi:hypothetical protein